MNTCSIHDLLRLALPIGTRLLTDEAGIAQRIQYVAGLRATLPAFPALHGGELVLISVRDALALDERLTLPSMIVRLADVPVGAIAVVGPVDDTAIESATTNKVPLLQLPATAHLRTIERDVFLLLDNFELQVERRAAQLYSRLTHQVANGEGVGGVLCTVHEVTGQTVALYDGANKLCAHQGPRPAHRLLDVLRPKDSRPGNKDGHPVIVKTVGKGVAPLGYIALCGTDYDYWDELATDQAAAALALELAKQEAVQAVEVRVGGELLQNIISGAPADMVVLQEQASELGYDLRRPHVALLIAPADGVTTAGLIREHLESELQRQQMRAPHVARSNVVLCLYPADNQLCPPAKLLQTLATTLPIGAGISAPAPTAAGWQQACAEAEQALALGRHLFGPRSLTSFGDLHVYRLLFALRGSPELWSFYHETLGALLEYDRRHNAALLQTLECYFAARSNLSQAAERLHIHRNTLLYRLRRIGQIAGVDMERSEDTLALQVALKAHRVLASPENRRQKAGDSRH